MSPPRKRRVNPLARDRQRQTMLELFADEDAAAKRIEAMQAGRRRARSPERLAEVEAKLETLGVEFKTLEHGDPRRLAIIREIRPLGLERHSLMYGRKSDDPTDRNEDI